MQAPNNPHFRQSLLIFLSLVLCLCFLIALEIWRPKHTEAPLVADAIATPVASAEPTVSPAITTPEPTQAPTEPTETPTETPIPTVSPEVLTVERPVASVPTESDPYPELYGDNPNQEFQPPKKQVVYLTFDDGPSSATPMLLDVLHEEGVKATFFVVGESAYKRELLKRIYDENHTLGVHTLTHNYQYVYQNMSNYLADFSKEYHQIWSATGYRPHIYRFPGGSVSSKNKHICQELIAEMNRRGFVYFDWNVTSEDAVGVDDPKEQLEELIAQSENKSRIIALLHDSAQNPDIGWVVREYIHHMREKGYQFEALDSTVTPIRFPAPVDDSKKNS